MCTQFLQVLVVEEAMVAVEAMVDFVAVIWVGAVAVSRFGSGRGSTSNKTTLSNEGGGRGAWHGKVVNSQPPPLVRSGHSGSLTIRDGILGFSPCDGSLSNM